MLVFVLMLELVSVLVLEVVVVVVVVIIAVVLFCCCFFATGCGNACVFWLWMWKLSSCLDCLPRLICGCVVVSLVLSWLAVLSHAALVTILFAAFAIASFFLLFLDFFVPFLHVFDWLVSFIIQFVMYFLSPFVLVCLLFCLFCLIFIIKLIIVTEKYFLLWARKGLPHTAGSTL